MIVLVHQICLLVESLFGWLYYAERKKIPDDNDKIGGKLEDDDQVDGLIPVTEEIIQCEEFKASLFAARRHTDYTSGLGITDETLNFPFLRDWRTISHIEQAKVMFIMRGLPGSGKSSIVAKISQTFRNSAVCSADHFFMQDGVYKFDQSLLSTAHDQCQKKAKSQCENGTPVIIIDNTNIKKWEMNRYFQFASENCYPIVIVEPKTVWKNDPVRLAAYNSHGVPQDVIASKLRAFEQVLPLYYGWFLNEKQSADLFTIANECLQSFPTSYKDTIKEEDFNINSKRMLHCTAMFMGSRNKPAPKRDTYPHSEEVQRSYGSVFDLQISRLTITSRSIGFQVKLSQESLNLYERPESDRREVELKARFNRVDPILERGCAAHITIGTIDGVTAKTTGDDALEIICKELEANFLKHSLFKFENSVGTVTMVTDDMFVIDLNKDKQRTVRGLFTGFHGNGGSSPRR